MTKRLDRAAQAKAVLKGLRARYPDAHCELDYRNPLELAVATILSAQCTDKRVNIVTQELFKKYRRAEDYAAARPEELEALVRSTGFFRSKAKSIRELGRILAVEHGGKVPDTMAELVELPGVARKTANVILGTAYGKAEGIAVDTHVRRLAFRLGLTDEKDPVDIEKDLMALLPRREWTFFSHALVWHGRRVCSARAPDCPGCGFNKICPKRGV